jgi:hypothetical protein
MFAISETFWLNLTNFGLAAVCVVCWVVMLGGLAKELVERRKRALAPVIELDDHAFHVRDLGWTLADGGEPVEPAAPAAKPGAGAEAKPKCLLECFEPEES